MSEEAYPFPRYMETYCFIHTGNSGSMINVARRVVLATKETEIPLRLAFLTVEQSHLSLGSPPCIDLNLESEDFSRYVDQAIEEQVERLVKTRSSLVHARTAILDKLLASIDNQRSERFLRRLDTSIPRAVLLQSSGCGTTVQV